MIRIPTHGSLAKAGKVRQLTPRQWASQTRKSKSGAPLKHLKPHKSPRVAFRKKYEKRIILGQRSGQRWVRKRRKR